MLRCEKEALEAQFLVDSAHVLQEELNYYMQNLQVLGPASALLAGFAYAALTTQMDSPLHTAEIIAENLFYGVTALCFCQNLLVSILSIYDLLYAPGLALFGSSVDSIQQARNGLMKQQDDIFSMFQASCFCFVLSVLLYAAMTLSQASLIIITLALLGGLVASVWLYCRVRALFRVDTDFKETGSMTVLFRRRTGVVRRR